MKILLRILVVALGLLMILLSCARQTVPSGGPRDTIPPILVSSNPLNRQLNFHSHTIELTFDEFVQLNDPSHQIIVTPRLSKSIKSFARRNKVILEVFDDWADSTTYTINFREAIQDVTEHNAAKNLKIAFSTGNYIDSLSISGTVYDLLQGQPAKNVMVGAVVPVDTFDVLKYQPLWFAETDDNGKFLIENLKKGPYFLYAFNDKNNDLIVNSNSEAYGFMPQNIQLDSSVDSLSIPIVRVSSMPLQVFQSRPFKNYNVIHLSNFLRNFTLTSDSASIIYSFIDDPSQIQAYPLPFLSVAPSRPDTLSHRVRDSLSQPPADSLSRLITDSLSHKGSDSLSSTPNDTLAREVRDSLSHLVIDSITHAKPDTLLPVRGDSLSSAIPDSLYRIVNDSLSHKVRDSIPQPTNDSLPRTAADSLPSVPGDSLYIRLTASDSLNESIDTCFYIKLDTALKFHETFNSHLGDATLKPVLNLFESSMGFTKPIEAMTMDSIYIERDSTFKVPIRKRDILIDTINNRLTIRRILTPDSTTQLITPQVDTTKAVTNPPPQPKIAFYAREASLITYDNDSSKSRVANVAILTPETSGIIDADVKTTKHFTLQLLTQDYKVVDEVKDTPHARFEYLKPGTYLLRLLVDLNNDGYWNPGNIRTRQQPEPVVYYMNDRQQREITIKENWELGPLLITYE